MLETLIKEENNNVVMKIYQIIRITSIVLIPTAFVVTYAPFVITYA